MKINLFRCAKKSRAFLSHPHFFITTTTTNHHRSSFSTAATTTTTTSSSYVYIPPSIAHKPHATVDLQAKDVAMSFQKWFRSRRNPVVEQIFQVLSDHNFDGESSRQAADLALSNLGLNLSVDLVLEVLRRGKDVLSCLKFFDWAGRQPGFSHSQITFNAIFKILSRAKLMTLMIDFLENYAKNRLTYTVRFYDTLVVGYSIAGKPEMALQMFGKMRFQGLDMDEYSYHIFLNALVEQNSFDVVDIIYKQIRMRGFENAVTHSILVKSFCKQNQLDKAMAFLQRLVGSGQAMSEHTVRLVVDFLCRSNKFEQAGKLVEELRELGTVPMHQAYGVWIKALVKAGKLDEALEYLRNRQSADGYIHDLFGYNTMVCKLLNENRLDKVFDLLSEMHEMDISPNEVTMNATLCFFCKTGMVGVVLELYNSMKESGLRPSSMAYNYLINILCREGWVDEAYQVLKSSTDQGYFPGKNAFNVISAALCREGELEKMNELLLVAVERNFMPCDLVYDKFIQARCKAGRVEDGYTIHGQLNRLGKVGSRNTYFSLINGFNESRRGDIAAELLIEMQEKGHKATRKLFRDVICCLCSMENPKQRFYRLLDMQLLRCKSSHHIYNYFIAGAGHARWPDLAWEVFKMMEEKGILPTLSTKIVILQSYLKNERFDEALDYFNHVSDDTPHRKLYHTMIVGLCKANRLQLAMAIFRDMRDCKLKPSLECYEELVKLLCANQKYDTSVKLIDESMIVGNPLSSFICNICLLHSMRTKQVYEAIRQSSHGSHEISCSSILSELIGAFDRRISKMEDVDGLMRLFEQCFPPDTYTYNMVLRKVCMNHMDLACELFHRLCQKGYEPNRWTYDILVHGFFRHGRSQEARIWLQEMGRKGFDPTEVTKVFI